LTSHAAIAKVWKVIIIKKAFSKIFILLFII